MQDNTQVASALCSKTSYALDSVHSAVVFLGCVCVQCSDQEAGLNGS